MDRLEKQTLKRWTCVCLEQKIIKTLRMREKKGLKFATDVKMMMWVLVCGVSFVCRFSLFFFKLHALYGQQRKRLSDRRKEMMHSSVKCMTEYAGCCTQDPKDQRMGHGMRMRGA